MKKSYRIIVKGKVQGVFFRATAKKQADELNVKGVIKNMPNGDVYIEAEGDSEKIYSFVEFCNEGPPEAIVEKVEKKEIKFKNYTSFEIIYK